MISELHTHEFYQCKGLLYEHGQMEAKAVIEGINPGRVFVDNRTSPTTGLIWLGNNDGFIFFGNERNEGFNAELNHFIDMVISPEAKEVGLDYFEGIGNHPKWNETIQKLFEHRELGSWNQRVYSLQQEYYKESNEPDLENGYEVVKIGTSFLENKEDSIRNIAFLQDKVDECWSSSERFLRDGIGYCVVYEDKIVAACLSGFVALEVHSIVIETLEEHRGKKLAQKLAHTFVQECQNKRSTPYWDCMESNKPSIAVAENLGFRYVFNYTGFEFAF